MLLSLVSGRFALAQETFQYVGSTGLQVWEIPSHWTGGSGLHSTYPGESPEQGFLDSADLTGPWSEDLNVSISNDLQLEKLTLGSTQLALLNNVVSATSDAKLHVQEIESSGSLISLNRIDADLNLASDLDITGTNSLTVAGKFVLENPIANEYRQILNSTNQKLDVQGGAILSATLGTPGQIYFRNGGTSTTHITGVISDGAAPGGRVKYAKGDFEIFVDSTYTGITQIGENDPNVSSTHVLHTDQPFGLGRILISGGNSRKMIRGAFGKGTRTLANDIQIAREVVFEGSEEMVLNGTVYQSNGRRLTNEIFSPNSLIINGNIFASDSTDLRDWRFDGSGTTIVHGIIDDSLNHPELTGGSITKDGSGRVIFTNANVAAYTGPTRISDGVLQLGDGNVAVNLNDNEVIGDATLEINHASSMVFAPTLSGSVSLRHVGAGETVLNRVSNGSGEVVVEAGTLLVNAGDGLTSGTGTGKLTVTGGTLGGHGHIGGSVTVSGGGTLAPGTSIGTLGLSALNLSSGGKLAIELGDIATNEFDKLAVQNDVVLDGSLELSLLESFSVEPESAFEILEVAGTRTGQFTGLDEGSLVGQFSGTELFITYQAGDGNDVGLFTTAATGDFNNDAVVSGQDYLFWQRSPEVGNLSDWQSAYGSLSAAAAVTVPEPSCFVLFALASITTISRRSH